MKREFTSDELNRLLMFNNRKAIFNGQTSGSRYHKDLIARGIFPPHSNTLLDVLIYYVSQPFISDELKDFFEKHEDDIYKNTVSKIKELEWHAEHSGCSNREYENSISYLDNALSLYTEFLKSPKDAKPVKCEKCLREWE